MSTNPYPAGTDPVTVALTNERNGYSAFNADYDPSPEAIAKVNEVFDFIETNPEKWDQDTYGNHLSETNCFMGLVCRLSGLITMRHPYFEDNGDVPYDFISYGLWDAMPLLALMQYEHRDRAEYVANFIEVRIPDSEMDEPRYPYRPPTLDEMRERVSIALNHDFRKPTDN